ncbi:MAG: bifunctional glutamate N-acetyltransferase/amino-acid acetyltransferase ArgJ [Pseudomonadota bacterium]
MNLEPSPFAPDKFPDLPDVKGVRAATARCGFYGDRDDVFLFVFGEATTCAGVFTRSTTASADVLWCRQALETGGGLGRALIVNAGNSNAFTGPAGVTKNEASLQAMVDALSIPKEQAFLAATGVIGEPLEDPNYVGATVRGMVGQLSAVDWEACARAFMTTDTYPKAAGLSRDIGGVAVNLAGISKGSGMIAPNMSTMLAYVFTDAAIAPQLLQELTSQVTEHSFNAITVDGDTSTSDTFMVFATGASGMTPITDRADPRFQAFEKVLQHMANELALQIVKDGEGISKLVSISVSGTQTDRDAKTIAASIANSPLVKTALAASDANWGRIVMAAGNASVDFDQSRLDIWFGDHQVAAGGARAAEYSETIASAACAGDAVDIRVSVGDGSGTFKVLTCDLTHTYIDINGAYRT